MIKGNKITSRDIILITMEDGEERMAVTKKHMLKLMDASRDITIKGLLELLLEKKYLTKKGKDLADIMIKQIKDEEEKND